MNENPNIEKQDAPALDVDSILEIHRDPEAHVAFVRKRETPLITQDGKSYTFQNIGSIRVKDLRDMFPAISKWLLLDSYFTVNSYYRARPWIDKITGFPGVWRAEKHLHRLNACYVDIDCGRPESEIPMERLPWNEALSQTEKLMENGLLPQASMYARSGRGIYLFWLLVDIKDPTKPAPAFMEKREQYKAINRALIERLRTWELPADTQAIDGARVLRTPGSIHTQTNNPVGYFIRLNLAGKPYFYTLPELSRLMQIPDLNVALPAPIREHTKLIKYRKTKKPGSIPNNKIGCLKLNALRAQDLLTMEQYRGGFLKRGMKYDDGHISPGRRFTLTLYANFLRGSGSTAQDALKALQAMASNMKPSYPSDDSDPDIEIIIKDTFSTAKRQNFGNEKLLPLLGITPAIARELGLLTIIPEEVKRERDKELPTHADKQEDILGCLLEYIQTQGFPSCRRASKFLADNGFTVSHETANKYLKMLYPKIQQAKPEDTQITLELQQKPEARIVSFKCSPALIIKSFKTYPCLHNCAICKYKAECPLPENLSR